MGWLRGIVQVGLGEVDRHYQRANRLQSVGPLLLVGRAVYRGPAIRFDDETPLQTGDEIGILHFNNAGFGRIQSGNSTGAALGFARLMLESMHDLAERAFRDPAFCDLRVFHAVSWLPAHGHGIGFVTRPVPDGIRKRILAAWFRLLVWAFAPAPRSRGSRLDPHFYWLTRKALLQRFAVTDRTRRLRHAQARPS